MQRVAVERLIPHPVEQVFRRYTDNAGWSRWAGVGPVRLVREGAPDKDGVGAVRAFTVAPGLREEVIVFEPPRRQEYQIIQGAFPITDHHGQVIFTEEGRGTLVSWEVTFRSRVPGVGALLERGLKVFFRRILRRLARDLDAHPQRE